MQQDREGGQLSPSSLPLIVLYSRLVCVVRHLPFLECCIGVQSYLVGYIFLYVVYLIPLNTLRCISNCENPELLSSYVVLFFSLSFPHYRNQWCKANHASYEISPSLCVSLYARPTPNQPNYIQYMSASLFLIKQTVHVSASRIRSHSVKNASN